jgi:tRNA pseudouridine13 synthase
VEIKRLPEDFQVEELTEVQPSGGEFALYRLTKRWIGTPEAVDAVLRAWKLPRRRLSYGGMKDFHAVATQHLTIHRGPKRDFHAQRFRLEYLGQTKADFASGDIRANRFRIVVRDLSEEEAPRLIAAAREIARDGAPNYFDEQRFGSVGESGDFVARPWMLGDWERALWLALADPNEHDSPADAKEKRVLLAHWRQWPQCKERLPRSHRRSIVTYLVDHPEDFRGAFGRLRVDMRRLYLSAFQSHFWNHMLAAHLCRQCRAEQLGSIPSRLGALPFPRDLDESQIIALRAASLPLPSSRAIFREESQRRLAEEVLGSSGLMLDQLRVKYPKDCFFSRGERKVLVTAAISAASPEPDDVFPGRRKLRLEFELPRGSYATIVIKRLTSGL